MVSCTDDSRETKQKYHQYYNHLQQNQNKSWWNIPTPNWHMFTISQQFFLPCKLFLIFTTEAIFLGEQTILPPFKQW